MEAAMPDDAPLSGHAGNAVDQASVPLGGQDDYLQDFVAGNGTDELACLRIGYRDYG